MASISITAFKDNKYQEEVSKWTGTYDPEKLELTRGNQFYNAIGGANLKSPTFNGSRDSELTFPLIFDSGSTPLMGSSAKPVPVRKQVDHFFELTLDQSGEIHQPNFLLVSLGDLIFKGQSKSMVTSYTAFRGGVPFRACVMLTLVESISLEDKRAKIKQSSPDLSHYIQVTGEESLASIAQRYYKDPMYCLELARINKLASPRHIQPGTHILVPPLTD